MYKDIDISTWLLADAQAQEIEKCFKKLINDGL